MTTLRPQITLLAVLLLILGSCGSKQEQAETPAPEPDQDSQMIQETLTEVARRLHYGDRAVFYDLEFEYLQDEVTFDEYLKFPQLEALKSDTIEDIRVRDVELFGRDSAIVDVEVIFVGPTGDTSRDYDTYRMYYHRDRWIHPTVGRLNMQVEYEEVMQAADSAAEADAEDR
jgi:hypothetical protein